jgi:predicted DNA-binding protein
MKVESKRLDKGGRPRVSDGSKIFTVKISPVIKQRLEQLSSLCETPISVIVRKALDEFLNQDQSLNEIPDDTYKVYMDFGEKVILISKVFEKYEIWKAEDASQIAAKKANLTFTITPELKSRLDAACSKKNETQSKLVEDAVDRWITSIADFWVNQGTRIDVFSKLGARITKLSTKTFENAEKRIKYESELLENS